MKKKNGEKQEMTKEKKSEIRKVEKRIEKI